MEVLEARTTRGGKALPTSARGQRTRRAILDAAARVFATTPYGDVTAAAITAEAGVSYGSFYVYFADVADLFVEIAQALIDEVWEVTRAPLRISDPTERLAEENRRYFAAYGERAHLFQLVEAVARTDPEFRVTWQEMRRRTLDRVAKGIRALQRQGLADPTLDPAVTAALLGGMAERAAYVQTLDPRHDEAAVQETLVTLWRGALGLRKEPGDG